MAFAINQQTSRVAEGFIIVNDKKVHDQKFQISKSKFQKGSQANRTLLKQSRLRQGLCEFCISMSYCDGGVKCGAFGKRNAKVAPLPAALSQASSPFMANTSFLTMLRPRPVEGSPPVGRAERRAYRRNIRALSSSVKPGPSS